MKLFIIISLILIAGGCFLTSSVHYINAKLVSKEDISSKKDSEIKIEKVSTADKSSIKLQKQIKRSSITSNIDEETDMTTHFYKASMAFGMPDKANIDDVVRAQLLIDPKEEVSALEKELLSTNKASGKIKISKIIIAKLVAPDFTIEPITPEKQAISMIEPTEWNWMLDPKRTGLLSVSVSVIAVVKIDGSETTHNLRTFDKTVKIEITPKQRISALIEKYWQWVFSTLILPLIAWFYKQRTKKEPADTTD